MLKGKHDKQEPHNHKEEPHIYKGHHADSNEYRNDSHRDNLHPPVRSV